MVGTTASIYCREEYLSTWGNRATYCACSVKDSLLEAERQKCYPPCRTFSWRGSGHWDPSSKTFGQFFSTPQHENGSFLPDKTLGTWYSHPKCTSLITSAFINEATLQTASAATHHLILRPITSTAILMHTAMLT